MNIFGLARSGAYLALAFAALAAGAGELPVPPKWSAVLTRSGAIETKHGHIQGICAAKDAVYMTLVNGLYKFDWSGRLVKRVEAPPHIGDICLWNDKLYVATCGEGGNRIDVYNLNLEKTGGTSVKRPVDGIACLDGVIYAGLGPAKDSGRPYRGNWFGKFDAATLKPIGEPFLVDHGEMSWLGVQNIATDGEFLYVNFYTPVEDIPNFFKFDKKFNVLGSWFLGCGHGFDVIGGARPGAVRFVHSCTVGIFDQKGDDPMPPQTLLRYAELTAAGDMEDVTKYESYVSERVRADTEIANLRVCRMTEPGDVATPVFSWQMKTERQGAAQKAYAISLKTADGRDVWQSGVVKDGASHAVKYQGPRLESATRYVWSVIVTDDRGKEFFSKPATFTTGLLAENDWRGSAWIAVPGAEVDVPKEIRKKQRALPGASCFERSIANGKAVKEAWWTVTGQGVFQAYVNGKPLPGFLKPGFDNVFKTRHSFTVDVTDMMDCGADGVNRFSAIVTSGWWRDRVTDWRGKESAFRAQLILRYADGTSARVGTGTDWRGAIGGPVLAAGIYDGEEYDARVPWPACGPVKTIDEFKGTIVPMEGPKITLREDLRLAPKEMYVWKGVTGESDDAHGKANIVRRYKPGEAVKLDAGETLVVDFGQNAAAVPEFVFSSEAGVKLAAEAGEMLCDGGGAKSRGNDGPEGAVYRGNLNELRKWGAKAEYVFAGNGDEHYRPEFTFFGYRYLSVYATGPVTIRSVSSVPVSSISRDAETGVLRTGVPALNRFVENVRWGQLSNYLSVPTDCPQRNERIGWTADTQVFCEAATRNADVYGFLKKWMRDMRDTQHDDGSFAAVAPLGAYGDRSERFGWCDAGVIVPYVLWKRYGDLSVVEENFGAIERYMELTAKNKFDSPTANPYQWADWLSLEDLESHDGGAFEKGPDGKERPKAAALVYWHFLGACYWLWDADMCAEMAAALGKPDAAEKYRKMSREAMKYARGRFLEADGMLPGCLRGLQTPALFALKFGIVADPKAVAATKAALLKNISDHGDCLLTGFLGTPIILDVLTEKAGDATLAYTLLLQRKNPSWLFSVDQGATTVWERWNGYSKKDGFLNRSMKSYNHYAYGAVLEWMYGTMAGIRPDPESPGWRHFILAPRPDRRLGRAGARFQSPYGIIESAWRYAAGGKLMWKIRIPANTTATVVMPSGEKREMSAGSYKLEM